MTPQEYIQRAYDITDRMSVSGGAVEQMAALRQALRDAYKALANQTQEKGAAQDGSHD